MSITKIKKEKISLLLLRDYVIALLFAGGLLHYLGFFACTIPYGAGFLVALFTRKKQGLQDIIGGTVVLKKA